MPDSIREHLARMAASMGAPSPHEAGSAPAAARPHDLPGDPDCPHCHGIGWLHDPTIPPGDPRFGKLQPCVCMESRIRSKQAAAAFADVEDLAGLTFENFRAEGSPAWPAEIREMARDALRVCLRYAERPEGWLVLQGNYGSGKTHLAAAIANAAVGQGIRTVIMTVPNLLDALRAGFGDGSYAARLDELRNVPLLILDDFGTQNATPWAREKLFQIVNDRYIKRLPLVVTTNQEFSQIEPRIRSRLQDTRLAVVVRTPPADYRTGQAAETPVALVGEPLKHLERFALEHFSDRPELGRQLQQRLVAARRTAIGYADAMGMSGNLIIMGGVSNGKTHLAGGIAHRILRAHSRYAMFVSVPNLLDHLRATFAPDVPHPYTAVFDAVCEVPLLVLDDFSLEGATPWAREKVFQIVNRRYMSRRPMVVVLGGKVPERLLYRIDNDAAARIILDGVPPFTPLGGRR